MKGPAGARQLKNVPVISVVPDSNPTSESNVRSRASSILSKASVAHENVKKKATNVLAKLAKVKLEIEEKPDKTSKLRFENGGSDSEAEDVESPKSNLELSSSSLENVQDHSSSSETNEFWDHDPSLAARCLLSEGREINKKIKQEKRSLSKISKTDKSSSK